MIKVPKPRGLGPLLGAAAVVGLLAGCARSEHPLNSPKDGFIDTYLLGTWYEVSVDADGMIDTPHDTIYEVRIGNDEILQITGNQKTGFSNVYSGHSTRLGANKFLNLRKVECRECGDLAASAARSDECPYYILQYSTFVPKELTTELRENAEPLADVLEAWMDGMRGQFLFYRGIRDEPVRESIAQGDIEGDTVMLDPYESVCIRSAGDALRSFVAKVARGSGMSEWTLLSRTSLRGKALDGIAIGTPRRALVTELLEGGCRGPDTIIGEQANEIVTLGYAESAAGYRVKRFKLRDGRLVEINYVSPDSASLFAHAAQQMTKRRHLDDWRVWLPQQSRDDGFDEEPYYPTLLECIDTLEAGESQRSSLEEAVEMLSDCMRDQGWTLLAGSRTGWPVCRGLYP